MKKMNDLHDLFSEQLRELYNAEKQQLETYQKFIKKSESSELKELLQKNLDKTTNHVKRIEDAMKHMGESKRIAESKSMKELLDRGLYLMKYSGNEEVLEAGLITAVQGVKHFEISLYGTLIAFADLLGKKEVSDILKKILVEEKALDKEFTQVAEESINVRAKEAEAVSA